MTTPTRTRLSPDARRTQLLDLGVDLLATRSLDELSIDVLSESAGVSRGLLYHYFGGKQDFQVAVVRHAVDELIAVTAPVAGGDLVARLAASLDRYVAYVEQRHRGYVSLVRSAASGNERLREIYEAARAALTDRIFDTAGPDGLAELGIQDSPGVRLLVRGWAALVEEVVLTWVDDHRGIRRDALLESLTATLAATLATAPGLQ